MAYLYRHVRLDNNTPFYIGVSTKDHRYVRAFCKNKRGELWDSIVSKSAYRVDIMIENIPENELYNKEREMIALYGRLELGTGTLVNRTNGGSGGCGVIVPESVRLKHSKSNKGKTAWNKGKTGLIYAGWNMKQEEKDRRRVVSIKKSVSQYTVNGEFIRDYESIMEASRVTGISNGAISAVVLGTTPTTGGYVFTETGKTFIPPHNYKNIDTGELYFNLEEAIHKTKSILSRQAFSVRIDKGLCNVIRIKPKKKRLIQ